MREQVETIGQKSLLRCIWAGCTPNPNVKSLVHDFLDTDSTCSFLEGSLASGILQRRRLLSL